MTKIVNLTPHHLNIFSDEGNLIASIPPSGTVARVDTIKRVKEYVDVEGHKVPISYVTYTQVQGLPPYPSDDTLYVVSNIVYQCLKGTKWEKYLIVPDTNPDSVVRDEAGRIKGVKGFLRID